MARFYAESSPTFEPAMRLVDAITQANPAQVTTSFDHDYRTGDIVRLLIPKWYGMAQLDQYVGKITVSGKSNFTVEVDSTAFDTFSVPSSPMAWYIDSYPQVVPVGEISANLDGATQNVL